MLEGWEADMVQAWRMFASGMGIGALPDPGGALAQPAIMLDAFAIMSAAEAELKKRNGD